MSGTSNMRPISFANHLLPRVRDLVFLIVFSVAMAAGWRTLNNDGDLPRHLLMGRVIVQSHQIPRQEIFSSIYEGRPYTAHEWLADVIYYLAYELLGLKGVALLTAFLLAATFYVLYWGLSRHHEERFATLVLVLWGAACTYQQWVARPHLFSMLFFSLWLVVVDEIGRGKRINPWLLPVFMTLWSCIHAEFISGFLVLIAYMAGWFWDYLFNRPMANPETLKSLAAAFAFSFAASLINPFGIQIWRTTLGYLGNTGLMSTILETRPPNFSEAGFLVEFALLIASILLLALKKDAIRSGHTFLLAGFTALALTSQRNVHLYGIVAPFVLAAPAISTLGAAIPESITTAVTQIEKQLRGFVWPAATVLVYLALLISGRIGRNYVIDPRLFPVQAVQWVEANPQSGRMFNDFLWGGYIVWQLWPDYKDFIDSQTDQTGEATKTYLDVIHLSDGWRETLDQHGVKWVLLPVDSDLGRELIKEKWNILYQDSTAIILRGQE